MKKYELINMSDKITFLAENDNIARAVALLLGNGKCGCLTEEGKNIEHCMTAFEENTPNEIYNELEILVRQNDKNLIFALKTVAVCGFNEREIYECYTENYKNKEKMEQWDNARRTSLNRFFAYSQRLAHNIEDEQCQK